jgi:ribosomal protein S27E
MPSVNEEYNEKIREICERSPTSCGTILGHKAELAYLREYIEKFTERLPDLPFAARIWFALTGRREYAKCRKCGNDLPHGRKCRPLAGYDSWYCSQECSQSSDEHAVRRERLCMERYGVKHPSLCPEIRKRISEGHLRRGREKIEESGRKRAETNMARYGVAFQSQRSEIASRCGETQRGRTEEEKRKTDERRRATLLERYGSPKYTNAAKARETYRRRCEEEPGFEDGVKERTRRTLLERYGVGCALQTAKCKENGRAFRSGRRYDEHFANNSLVEPVFSREYYVAHHDEPLRWRCRKCGAEFEQRVYEHQPFFARCLRCFPFLGEASGAEKELAGFVRRTCGAEVVENTRSVIPPKELDVYVPQKGLAVEFDGLFWHSENAGAARGHHLEKTEACEGKGIRLVHVFESEWLFKKEIVESRLAGMLGRTERTIYARKCEPRDVVDDESGRFLDENHLQGRCMSKVRLGLYSDGELVALMTFGKCRFDKSHEWEMLRFCSKLNTRVVGGAGKLLSHFEKNYQPKSLVTYADRRWSGGGLYRKLGFRLDHVSSPDYWYWDHARGDKHLLSRVRFQKHRLKGLLEVFDPEKSERDNMAANGYYRIFDCGNYVFDKTY